MGVAWQNNLKKWWLKWKWKQLWVWAGKRRGILIADKPFLGIEYTILLNYSLNNLWVWSDKTIVTNDDWNDDENNDEYAQEDKDKYW